MNADEFLNSANEVTEVRVVIPADSGETRTPIWIVTTNSQAFIRSYRADRGRWYKYLIAAEVCSLETAGEVVTVRPTSVDDLATLEEVSAAYAEKYQGEVELADMLSPAVVATTLNLQLVATEL